MSKREQAIDKEEQDKWTQALQKVRQALSALIEAGDVGADTTEIIEHLLEDVEEVVFEAMSEAELIAEAPCPEIDSAWDQFYSGLMAADESRYQDALTYYEAALTLAEEAQQTCSAQ